MEIKINEEFSSLHSKTSEENYQKLEKNLKMNGCYRTVRLYQGDLVDGFDEYNICTRNNIPYTTQEMSFSSKKEAVIYIIMNQLERQDITSLQRYYLIGKRYQIEKTAPGKQSHKKKHNPNERFKIGEVLAKELKTSSGSVRRAGTYAASIDLISKDDEELKNDLLTGKIKVRKEEVNKIAGMSCEDRGEIIRNLKAGDLNKFRKSIRLNTTGVPGRIIKLPTGHINNEQSITREDEYYICIKCEPALLTAAEIIDIYNHTDKNINIDNVYYKNGYWYCSDRLRLELKDIFARLANSYDKKKLTLYLFTTNIMKILNLESETEQNQASHAESLNTIETLLRTIMK